MAVGGLALHADERARLLICEVEHLRRLCNRFGKLELPRIDALEVVMPAGPRGGTAFRGRAESFEVNIFDPRLFESGPKRRLRKARAPRQRQRAHVDYQFDSGM